MIKILKYGEVANSEIFARVVPEMDVEAIVADIIENVKNKFLEQNFSMRGLTFSPIKGGSGNIEYLMYLTKDSASADIDIRHIINEAFSKMH